MKMINISKRKSNSGFSLIEVIIVIVILGILGVIAATGYSGITESARAEQKMALATEGTKVAKLLFTRLGSGTNTPNNPIVHANNSLEDVLLAGVGVSAAYQARYDSLNADTLQNAVVVMTVPVEDVSAGVYHVGNNSSVVSIQAPANNREMNWQFTNVPSIEVEQLINTYDNGAAFNSAVAKNTGRIRHTAAVNGIHTLTIVNRL